jgi:hypothetical protein
LGALGTGRWLYAGRFGLKQRLILDTGKTN